MTNPETPSGSEPFSGLLSIRAGRVKPWRRLAGRNFTKADILLYRLDGSEVAVKDYGARSWVVRNTLGRLLIARETRAYRAATGLPGIPGFLGRSGPFALALRYVHATPVAELREPPPPACFDRLESLVRALHGRGIALGDLHHRDVLVSADGSVWVVDLAMAWVAGPRSGSLRRAVFRRLAGIDLVAVARMRARASGEDVERAAELVGGSAAAWHARGRRLKSIWNRIRRQP